MHQAPSHSGRSAYHSASASMQSTAVTCTICKLPETPDGWTKWKISFLVIFLPKCSVPATLLSCDLPCGQPARRHKCRCPWSCICMCRHNTHRPPSRFRQLRGPAGAGQCESGQVARAFAC
eukprot:355524-Chlamydomonas_euryale.AAC.40